MTATRTRASAARGARIERTLRNQSDLLTQENTDLRAQLAYLRPFVAPEYAPSTWNHDGTQEDTDPTRETRLLLTGDRTALTDFYEKEHHQTYRYGSAAAKLRDITRWEAFGNDAEIFRNPEAAGLLAHLRLVLSPRGLKGLDFHRDIRARIGEFLARSLAEQKPASSRLLKAYNALTVLIEEWQRKQDGIQVMIDDNELVGAKGGAP